MSILLYKQFVHYNLKLWILLSNETAMFFAALLIISATFSIILILSMDYRLRGHDSVRGTRMDYRLRGNDNVLGASMDYRLRGNDSVRGNDQ